MYERQDRCISCRCSGRSPDVDHFKLGGRRCSQLHRLFIYFLESVQDLIHVFVTKGKGAPKLTKRNALLKYIRKYFECKGEL